MQSHIIYNTVKNISIFSLAIPVDVLIVADLEFVSALNRHRRRQYFSFLFYI